MKATIDGTAVADAPDSDLISIEGNHYFPPSSLSAAAPYPASFDQVGKDYTGYVAFDKQQVTVAE